MFEALKRKLFPPAPIPFLGALPDERSEQEKREQDIHITETVAAATAIMVIWRELKREDVRTFGVQNQTGKSTCVAETRRKLKRILFKVNKGLELDFSSAAFYLKRMNYPFEGMVATDAIDLDATEGMTLDALVPSDAVKTEAAANALKPDAFNDDVAKVFRIANADVTFTPGDLDTVAATIQKTRKGAMLWFYFTSAEWSQEVPVVKQPMSQYDARALRHSVTGIEPALYKGQEGIWIDDSAHFGGLNRRFITRAFFQARNIWSSYPIAFKFESGLGKKPKYDGSIVSLQLCLKYEGTFPANIDATGVNGPVTKQAVKDFQARYGIEMTGTVGPITTSKLKERYP